MVVQLKLQQNQNWGKIDILILEENWYLFEIGMGVKFRCE